MNLSRRLRQPALDGKVVDDARLQAPARPPARREAAEGAGVAIGPHERRLGAATPSALGPGRVECAT